MSITTIMTMLDGAQRDQIDLEAAGHLMSRFDCHCDLLHVRRDPITALPMIGEGMSADLVDIVQAQVEKDEALRAEECQVVFKTWAEARNAEQVQSPTRSPKQSVRLLDVTGSIGNAVARYGKLADLVVLPAPSLDDGRLSSAAEAAIYDTGRPVLFSPRKELKALGNRVAIFWNDTAEVSRAVVGAMPFLEAADSVQVMAVADDSFDASAVTDFAGSLVWRGISAEVHMVTSGHLNLSPGEALLEAAADFDADLIVMGAYSYSHLREMILGGVTQHILQVAGRPVLMMH